LKEPRGTLHPTIRRIIPKKLKRENRISKRSMKRNSPCRWSGARAEGEREKPAEEAKRKRSRAIKQHTFKVMWEGDIVRRAFSPRPTASNKKLKEGSRAKSGGQPARRIETISPDLERTRGGRGFPTEMSMFWQISIAIHQQAKKQTSNGEEEELRHIRRNRAWPGPRKKLHVLGHKNKGKKSAKNTLLLSFENRTRERGSQQSSNL